MPGRWRKRDAESTARSAAAEDARALALGLAGLAPMQTVDPMSLGLVLESDESAYRVLTAWTSYQEMRKWSQPTQSRVIVTERRLIVCMPQGLVQSWWWRSLVGFHPDLARSSLVLDFGDGFPRMVSGAEVASAIVVGAVELYGVTALAEHEALESLRDPVA